MSELSTADGRNICSLQGLRISHASSAEGASFTAFLSRAAALKLSADIPPAPILDSDDGTRYRATIHAVTVDKNSPGSALASIRGTVLQLI
ncbi:MAG TPA: hypothetical protein VK745_14695 [Polyangiaceae bacterium]|jgi:hypothetical protein|nr:hypothetical protein [Polyangiaceae bacterium]